MMKVDDAYEILGLKSDASEAERHDAFRLLQTKLEDKLGRAPTPGLKEKYRASLLKLEQAIEVIELSMDGADLPMLRPDYDDPHGVSESTERIASLETVESKRQPSAKETTHPSENIKPSPQGEGNRKEVLMSVLVVLLLIAVGAGWWFGYESPRRLEVAELVQKAVKLEEKGELENAVEIFEKALVVKSSSKDAKEGLERVNGELDRIEAAQRRTKEQEASELARNVERLVMAARMDQTQEKMG
jgi:hypothetical protein